MPVVVSVELRVYHLNPSSCPYLGGNLPYVLILDGETVIGVEEQYLP